MPIGNTKPIGERYHFTVTGHPITQGSMRSVGKGRMLHSNPKLDAWRREIAFSANKAHPDRKPWDGGVALHASFVFKDGKDRKGWRDTDKLARAVMDALTGVTYADDSQVVLLVSEKVVEPLFTEGVTITVWRRK
jgi:crossover junction endodeoxyribonuclease RusA